MENDSYSDELKSSVDQANDLLESGAGDETTSDDPRLTSASESDRRARYLARARETRDRLNAAINDFGHRAGEGGRRVRESAEAGVRQGISQTETSIKDNPFVAVGVAAGVGLLLGLLINRSSR